MDAVLPPCQEPSVKFSLPRTGGALPGEIPGPSAEDVFLAMNAVTAALAGGEITPGEAERIAGVVDTFVRAIETTKRTRSGLDLMQILTAGDYDEDDSEDDSDESGDGETGDYEES